MRSLASLALLAAGCVSITSPEPSGGINDPGVEQVPPRFVIDGGARTQGPLAADAGFVPGQGCLSLSALPIGCDLVGEWRLLHSQPDSPCPFGASRHVIRMLDGISKVCLETGQDFQLMEAGPPGLCAVRLFGFHQVFAAAEPYTETWSSDLTFTGNTGTGQTLVVVSGGNNCMRKFQTTIDRK
jgi:hypothetical protein